MVSRQVTIHLETAAPFGAGELASICILDADESVFFSSFTSARLYLGQNIWLIRGLSSSEGNSITGRCATLSANNETTTADP